MKHVCKALLILGSLPAIGARAQSSASAPIPAQIGAAKTVFVSNAGAVTNAISERAYSVFYAGLSQWNKYQLASAPSAAELILEIHYSSPLSNIDVANGGSLPPTFNPRFELVVIDRATHVTLWSAVEYPSGTRKDKFEQTNDNAVNALVADLKALAAGQYPSAAADAAQPEKK